MAYTILKVDFAHPAQQPQS